MSTNVLSRENCYSTFRIMRRTHHTMFFTTLCSVFTQKEVAEVKRHYLALLVLMCLLLRILVLSFQRIVVEMRYPGPLWSRAHRLCKKWNCCCLWQTKKKIPLVTMRYAVMYLLSVSMLKMKEQLKAIAYEQ